MTRCPRCQEPMLGTSTSTVCGRCEPPTDGVKQIQKLVGITEQTGRNGDYESLAGDMSAFEDAAPAVKCFAYWDTTEDVAVLMASEISGHRLTYGQGRSRRFWPHAEESHPNYRGKTVGGLV